MAVLWLCMALAASASALAAPTAGVDESAVGAATSLEAGSAQSGDVGVDGDQKTDRQDTSSGEGIAEDPGLKGLAARVDRLEQVEKLSSRVALLEQKVPREGADRVVHAVVAAVKWIWTEPMKLVLSGVFFTFVVGLLKARLDGLMFAHQREIEVEKFRHERVMKENDQRNKWRSDYLDRALDIKTPLEERLKVFRFLAAHKGEGADASLAEWAQGELERHEEAMDVLLELYNYTAVVDRVNELLAAQFNVLGPTAVQQLEKERQVALESRANALRRLAKLHPAQLPTEP